MCGEHKSIDMPCRHVPPVSGTYLFNPDTGEVFDKDDNLIGYGTPIVKDFKIVSLSMNILVRSHLIKD